MKLYHGSNIENIKILEPRQADHDKPYVYLTTSDVVASFYLCNAVAKPYYWFPYGFTKDTSIPIYHELYPNALKDVSEGISGYIYEIEVEPGKLKKLSSIPCARLSIEPVQVFSCTKIENAYTLFKQYVEQGKMKVGYFQSKTEQQLQWWYSNLEKYLIEKNMYKQPNCSYVKFIKEKFPQIWTKYISALSSDSQ